MLLLSTPFEPAAPAPPRPPLRPFAQIAAVAGLIAGVGLALSWFGPRPAVLGHGLASGAVHAGLIGLGWLVATRAVEGWVWPVVRLGATITIASVVGRLGPWGPIAFLLIPIALLIEAHRRPEIRAIGLAGGRVSQALTGVAAGGFLGVHLLLTASRTFGYRTHVSSLATYLDALAYDAGVNVLSAEWLFRGAVFSLLWRRWSFWPAALLATALGIARYLLDPALPHAPEARAGAVFYLGAVGLAACALRAWSGSLLPGYAAALAFFAAYRTLTP